MIFIKGAKEFEAKKAITYELEAHSHDGVEERKMEMERNGGWSNFEGEKGRKMLAYWLSWVGFLVKLIG